MSRGHAFWAMLLLTGLLGLSSASVAAEEQQPAADPAPSSSSNEDFYKPFGSGGDSAGSAEVAPAAQPAAADSAAAEQESAAEPAAGEAEAAASGEAGEQDSADPSGFYNSFIPGGQAGSADPGSPDGTQAEAPAEAATEAAAEDSSVAIENTAAQGSESWGDDCCKPAPNLDHEHVFAQGICADCGCKAEGTGNWISLAGVYANTDGNMDSVDQYGYLPREWYSSGKLHWGDSYFSRNRFELRWDDVNRLSGRAWSRLTLWPMTLEGDSYIMRGSAWDSFGNTPLLTQQEVATDSLRLRWHRGEWDNMLLEFRQSDVDKKGITPLGDYSYRRLAYQYNFDIGCDVKGQFRQTGTSFDAPASGITNGEIDSSMLKLDAQLSDEISAYGKLSASAYEYEQMPDPEFASQDYTLGLRYAPDCEWEFSAEYRAKENADDNVVSSHVENFSEYGLSLAYAAACGGLYEAGIRHRDLDYAKLNMQDAFVFGLLRSGSIVRPVDVASATTILTPKYDEAWFNMRQQLGEDFFFTTRVDYSQGDMPSSELTAAGSSSLFYDKRLSRTHGLSYVYDNNNQFDFALHSSELSNDGRASDFDENYFETVWTHAMDDGRFFSLAYRGSEAELAVPGNTDGYTTDNSGYVASYSNDDEDVSYALRLGLDDGSGAEEYTQTSAGADFKFKCLGPVGLHLEWYDRSYGNFPGLSASAMTVAVDYKLEF
ncbi:hypothetical protein IT575_00535 [bacterium]|nr:hypothetical protein [bacterium]